MENQFRLQGVVTFIGDLVQIRRTGKPDIFKKVLSIETLDKQVLYPEIRNQGLKVLEREGVEEGHEVDITFEFQGSEKGDKRYNNILITSIKRI